ncbi:hypothetical protein PVL30_002426 [Lodderomyces elongisporus]|uniref:uncharacterized protein n=1 Tax=Lodderomyces elongisporus TaxID=36914 RepID=UPI00291CD529|nr:uncharacterized protein PVL30_002426 [Lodderomyces elongisporus]WLF78686.1 hypothetical protein PVL30_002426 [Lodderomyces elongisporus]
MVIKRVLNVSNFKCASRHYIPIKSASMSYYSASEVRRPYSNNMYQETKTLNTNTSAAPTNSGSEEVFHPTIHGDEEVLTAGPVNRA